MLLESLARITEVAETLGYLHQSCIKMEMQIIPTSTMIGHEIQDSEEKTKREIGTGDGTLPIKLSQFVLCT